MKIRLWQTGSTEKAIKFAVLPPEYNEGQRQVWVPRSVIEHVSRDRALPNGWRPCMVELADWFAEKEELG